METGSFTLEAGSLEARKELVMALTVKEITLWRREIDNRPGMLAQALGPLAKAKTDVEVLMAYRFPGDESRGAVELFPISGKKATAAAHAAGLTPADDIPAVLVTGSNRAGIGFETTTAIAENGINLAFVVAQVIGATFSAVYGFDNEADRRKAVALLKKSPRSR
jgi:predicted amino acid-binding ACT domain protein